MAWRSLDSYELITLLQQERIVRVAFCTEDERYVVPLGFVWFDHNLWGTTRHGRKTAIAGRDNRVAFTIDDSASATPFQWRSVVGEGRFETVTPDVAAGALSRFAEQFPDNPEWNVRDFVEGLADGSSTFWRIEPTDLAGRIHFDPDRPE